MKQYDINSDVECEQSCNCCNIIKPNANLFSTKSREGGRRPVDNNIAKKLRYAVTVNIHPYKSMNKKRWFTYSHDKQRSQLARIEEAFRRKNPSVQLIELHYEIAPAVNDEEYRNVHFHALYEMPENFNAQVETYYNRICGCKEGTWKHIKIDPIYHEHGWIDYIRKDIGK